MAKINDTTTYPHTAPALGDHIPGTDISNTTNDANGESVTFTFQAAMDLFEANMTVPTSVSTAYRTSTILASTSLGQGAALIGINDAGTFYTGTTVEAALAEIGALLPAEANADVTDATNVDAAGAVMNADTTTAGMSFVIDEDTMVSDLATKVPTQQSVKAYVDTTALLDSEVTNLAQVKAFDSTDYAAASHTHAAADIDAEASTDGFVLTSDGAGNAAWEAVPSGGAPEGTSVLSTGPVTDGYVLTADGAGGAAWEAAPGGAGGDAWSDAVDSDILPTGAGSTYDIGSATATFAEGHFDNVQIGSVLKMPSGTSPTVDAEGEIALDTDTNNFDHGVIFYHDGTEELGLLGFPVAEIASIADGVVPVFRSGSVDYEINFEALSAIGDSWTDAVDSDIVPTGAGSTYDIGSATYAFAEGHFDTLYVGGTALDGTQLADPDVDALIGWDDTAGSVEWFTGGTGISITPNSIAFDLTASPAWTGAHDFGGATSLEIPNSTGPTVDAAGEIAIDTSVANWGHGILFYHDGTEARYVMALTAAQAGSPSDQTIPIYNASTDIFEMSYVEGVEIKSAGPVTDGYVLTADGAGGAAWEAAGTGTVDTSGTPEANDFARFTDANTIEGRSYAEVRSDLGLVIGTNVEAADADILKADTSDNLTVGFTSSVDDDGSQSGAGTYAPDPATGNYKQIENAGAFTFNPPSPANDIAVSVSVLVINHATTAGTITVDNFTQVTGDSFDTTGGNKFLCRVDVYDDGGTEYSLLQVVALQ